MKKKNLLPEGTVRRFMKLANIASVSPVVLREQDEEVEDLDVEAEEGPPLPDEGGEGVEDLDLEVDLGEAPPEDDGAARELAGEILSNEGVVDALAAALEEVGDVSVDGSAAVPAEEEDVDVDVGLEAGPEGDELDVGLDVAEEGPGNRDELYQEALRLLENKAPKPQQDLKKWGVSGKLGNTTDGGFDKNDGLKAFDTKARERTSYGHLKEDSGREEGEHYREDAEHDAGDAAHIRNVIADLEAHLHALEKDEHYDERHIAAEGTTGASKGDESKTHPGEEDYTWKRGEDSKTDSGTHDDGSRKGDKSKTHPGKDYEPKKANESLVNELAMRVAARLLNR